MSSEKSFALKYRHLSAWLHRYFSEAAAELLNADRAKVLFALLSDPEPQPRVLEEPKAVRDLIRAFETALTPGPMQAALDYEQRLEILSYLGQARERLRSAAPAPSVPAWQDDAPQQAGWWMCSRGGREKWFEVKMLSESGEPPLKPMIWISDIVEFVPVEKVDRPLDKWFGPVVVTER